MSAPEDTLAMHLRAVGISFTREYRAIPTRRFKWDFMIPASTSHPPQPILIEVQGGIWRAKGAHNTGRAIQRDCEKNNLATIAGYRTLMFTPDMVISGEAITIIEEAICAI